MTFEPLNTSYMTFEPGIAALLGRKQYKNTCQVCDGQGWINWENGIEVERPIHFLSHRLSDTQTRWSIIEKEKQNLN